MEEGYLLEQSEFQVLAATAGIENVYGIEPKEKLDESAMMYAIHEMAGKGILGRRQDGTFYVNEPFCSAFQSIKKAEYILAVSGTFEEAAEICFYFGEKIISLEESLRDEDALKIGIFEKEELFSLLQERQFLPKPLLEPDLAVLQTEEDMLQGENRKYAGYLLFSGCRGQMTSQAEWTLIENPFNYWIAEKINGETRYFPYDGQNLYDKILSLL